MADSNAALSSAWMVAGTMAEILLVVSVGSLGAYFGIIPAHMRKELSGLCMNLLLPPFLFIKLSRSVNLSLLNEWWLIPVFVVLNLIIGFALGLAVEKLLGGRVKKTMAGTFLVACGVGNAGTIPMAVMYSVCDQELAKFEGREGSCTDDALAMISLGIAVAAGFFWTFGPSLLRGRNKAEQNLEGHEYKEMEEQREERTEEKEQGRGCNACSTLHPSLVVEAAAGNNSGVASGPEEALDHNGSGNSSSNSTKIVHIPPHSDENHQPTRTAEAADTTSPPTSSSATCTDSLRSAAKGAKAFLNSASISVLAGELCLYLRARELAEASAELRLSDSAMMGPDVDRCGSQASCAAAFLRSNLSSTDRMRPFRPSPPLWK
eukprot:104273-Rhodomonas_salina.2